MTKPVQEFQIGQRVRRNGGDPFVISLIMLRDGVFYYGDSDRPGHSSCFVTLAPEPPPYVPSERRVLGRAVTIARYQPELYRCETDAELVARHVIERAEYNAQGDGV